MSKSLTAPALGISKLMLSTLERQFCVCVVVTLWACVRFPAGGVCGYLSMLAFMQFKNFLMIESELLFKS